MSERKGTKALELWCKRLVKDCPNVQIDNMTTSWRNGIAFCALVHHFRPDLIDMSTLKPENIYYNNQLAFNIAETQLGIPALLDPEDMVENEIPDRLSILTYLSQFYQRLGNTGPSKTMTEDNQKEISTVSPIRNSPMKLKSGYDKCSMCELPVYLAQRLIVSNKLYHRRCFRCAKCDGQLSPNSSFDSLNGSEFWCDSCKSEKAISKYLNNNNDCMGMLNFTQRLEKDSLKEEGATMHNSGKPKSILEKINMFEKGFGDNENINDKIEKLSLREERRSLVKPEQINSEKHIMINNGLITTDVKEASNKNVLSSTINTNSSTSDVNSEINKANDDTDNSRPVQFVDKLYKSDINKFNFLQTQLSSDLVEEDVSNPPQLNNIPNPLPTKNESVIIVDNISSSSTGYQEHSKNVNTINMTDEYRLASNTDINNKFDTEDNKTKDSSFSDTFEGSINENKTEIKEVIPPRRKKQIINNKAPNTIQNKQKSNESVEAYPDHLNPFSDEEDEVIKKPVSTNPFGSSDEEENDISISVPNSSNMQASTPIKRLIPALNPFWSDGEEPSSEDEHSNIQSSENMYSRSSIITSTPNFPSTTPRKKSRAPPPPTITLVKATENDSHLNSMEDVASLSSVSSYCSTVNSDHKTSGKLTPRPKKKRPAPTPSDSISYLSTGSRDFHKSNTDITDKSNDLLGHGNHTDGCTRKVKGPAPGLPLPERREVKPQISPEELQVQLDLLEAQQLGLERQGVLIEQMIRDRCEGDESTSVSQEEVEDLVIQLCELVNEKNDLFRKQTELMYIRRQQRLEQEQADIEHEIRIIQSRPAVNRIDADKAREEHLVSRLVEIVRLRDELVQQMDAERRREIQEDLAIAASIAERRAQRNSDSNTSSMTSVETGRTTKKTKVKDKVKKQLKKAKHSLNIKKKEEQDGPAKEKEKNPEKNHKTKWF